MPHQVTKAVCSVCKTNTPLYEDGEPTQIARRVGPEGKVVPICFRCWTAGKINRLEQKRRDTQRFLTEVSAVPPVVPDTLSEGDEIWLRGLYVKWS